MVPREELNIVSLFACRTAADFVHGSPGQARKGFQIVVSGFEFSFCLRSEDDESS